MNYTNNELELIKIYNHLPFKKCKQCEKDFPINAVFFLKEKRLPDGFENKCRMCRVGKLMTSEDSKGRISIDQSIKDRFKTVQEIYENFMIHNKLPYRSFILDNHKEIFTYIIEKENIPMDELYNLNRDWFKDKRLYSPLLKLYEGKIFDFIDNVFPNLFKPWERITVGKKYWNVKENRLYALKWLVEQLLKDNVISSIEEIPRNVNGTHFQYYSLNGLLEGHYGHPYNAFNELYPNKFYVWQYKLIIQHYFDSKENRINSLKELVNHLKLNILDIPKVFSYEYFNLSYENEYLSKFKQLLDNTYNDIFDYVNEVYPNTFKQSDFPYMNHYPTLDNIIVRSEPERMIHHLFMRNNLNYKYGDHVGRMNIDNVNVLPDWYIYKNDKIYLVEYYGMLDMNGVDFGYNDKYELKEGLYNKLCKDNEEYVYIALHKEDMKDNFKGIRNKLNK